MSQERFTTSREVYHRIRWDPRLDAREFVIGYDAHLEQLEEMPFEAFVPDGEIPWHRVWYFKRGRQVVWDRKERLDLLASLTPPPEPPAPSRAGEASSTPAPGQPGFTPLPVYRFDARAGAWVGTPAKEQGPRPRPSRLTVASFNVLFDVYDAEQLATEQRTPAVLALLKETEAEVIALQEVTPGVLRALQSEPWVREHYWLSEGRGAATVTPYGQVLLSRVPFSALCQRVFTRDKRIIAGRLAFEDGAVWVATPHLMSNRDPSGHALRATQVQTLIDWARTLEGTPDVVLAGDFNFGDGEPENAVFAQAGFVDVWPALRPSERGETFDPSRNALAAVTTTSGLKRRLDRVWVLSPGARLVPEAVTLFGESPLEGAQAPAGGELFASDHFGLRCVLRHGSAAPQPVASTPARARTAQLVHHTAVVLIPPEDVWEPIQALRRKHDSKVHRWMPHVTLLYPFLPEALFDDAEALLAEALREVKPFEVSLSEFSHFEHRANATAWLRPEARPHGALQALQAVLEKALPECNEQGRKSARGFTPHLSVGQLPRSGTAGIERTLTAWARGWRPLSFEVREVCIIRRKGDTPFEVVRRVPLGGTGGRRSGGPGAEPGAEDEGSRAEQKAGASSAGEAGGDASRSARTPPTEIGAASEASRPARKPGASPVHTDELLRAVLTTRGTEQAPGARAARTKAVERLHALCEQVGAELHPYGSFLLGTDGVGSDVDAVAIGPAGLSREGFAKALLEELAHEPGSASGRFVADAAIPLVKLALGGVSFDVSYASRPEGVAPCPPEALLALPGEGFDAAGLRSLLGLADMRRLLDVVTHEGAGLEPFRALLRTVKVWARARGIYSHALGYLGGLSWAVLGAWACTRAPREEAGSGGALLARFFETFATWPWPQPVTLTPETARYRPEGKRDLLPVIAPAAPTRNTARNVSRSTFRVLREELTRARDLVARARNESTASAWEALFEPVDLSRETSARLVLSIGAPSAEDREASAGWVLGHLTALVYRLEGDRRLFTRPLPASSPEGPFLIGLAARTSDGAAALSSRPGTPLARTVEEFSASFRDWSHRPSGAALRMEVVHG